MLRRFLTARVADELAAQMLNVAIGWQVYNATSSALGLAFVGLAQFVPSVGLALFAGQAADRFDRRRLALLASLLQCGAVLALGAIVLRHAAISWVYPALVLLGAARSFSVPAYASLLPRLVGDAGFPRAVAASATAYQLCVIGGPPLGGLLIAAGSEAVYGTVASLYLFAALALASLGPQPPSPLPAAGTGGVLGGLRYLGKNRLLLALTSLDLFAVMLGGATALLPIYARDVLDVGPVGLGALRCAPGVGATVVGLLLARRTLDRGTGRWMLRCVAGFGVATVVFALSTHFWLSIAALVALGAFDMVSMVIRQTLVQLATPDEMRGRVSAVNGIFISASSELGEFESGATAALFGAVPAAALGGLGTLVVVLLWRKIFPELENA